MRAVASEAPTTPHPRVEYRAVCRGPAVAPTLSRSIRYLIPRQRLPAAQPCPTAHRRPTPLSHTKPHGAGRRRHTKAARSPVGMSRFGRALALVLALAIAAHRATAHPTRCGTPLLKPTARQAACAHAVFAATPAQTRGPFYLEPPTRRNLTAGGRSGVPLQLTLRVRDRECQAFPAGVRVGIWSAGSDGSYSGFEADGARNATLGDYGRGAQVTNDTGSVTFDTVVPSFYEGRVPHVHVLVEYDGGASELATQLYFPSSAIDRVHSAYGRGPGEATYLNDVVLKGDKEVLAALTLDVRDGGADDGLAATFVIAVDTMGTAASAYYDGCADS